MVTCQELRDGNASQRYPVSGPTDAHRSSGQRSIAARARLGSRLAALLRSVTTSDKAPLLPAMPSGFDDHRRCSPTRRRSTLIDTALLGPECSALLVLARTAAPDRRSSSRPPPQECASRSLGDAFSLAAVAPGSSRTPALSCPVRSTNTRCVRRSVGHPRRPRRR